MNVVCVECEIAILLHELSKHIIAAYNPAMSYQDKIICNGFLYLRPKATQNRYIYGADVDTLFFCCTTYVSIGRGCYIS